MRCCFSRHVLNKDFEEIEAIFEHLSYPYDLVAKLLYGCGLRLSECLNLRINNFNFDACILTVHDGKGQKDRTVPIPQVIFPEIQAHLESLKDLHQRDLDRDYDGVFLVNALEEKYKNAARDFIWQWFFPAKQLTYVEKTGERRRYTIFMKRMCNRQSSRQLVRREFVRERQPTLFATVLQATSCRPITISGRFRNYLGTVMCELQ